MHIDMSHRLRLAALLLAIAAAVAAVDAALPTFWQVSTEAEFLRGEVENLSIDSYGRLTLGPTSTPVYDSSAPFIWTAVTLAGRHRSTPAAATKARSIASTPSGKGGVFFDSEELEVHAIAPAPGGGIYVGTSPQGKIYKVDASGKVAVFFDPPIATSGASPSIKRERLRRDRRQGPDLQDHAGRQGRSLLRNEGDARHDARLRPPGTAARRHRIARPRVPNRRDRQAVRHPRLELQRNPHPPRRRKTGRSMRLR